MKALTLKQPYASLIANGLKEYEFRSWKTNYRGELYIHAGTGIDKDKFSKFSKYNLEYPKSKIVCKVRLIDCIKIDDEFNKKIISMNSDIYGTKPREGYAWKIELIEKIDSDKIIKGKLGLWNLDIEKDL